MYYYYFRMLFVNIYGFLAFIASHFHLVKTLWGVACSVFNLGQILFYIAKQNKFRIVVPIVFTPSLWKITG